MKQEIQVYEVEIQSYQKQIDAETARLAVDNSAEKEERLQEIEVRFVVSPPLVASRFSSSSDFSPLSLLSPLRIPLLPSQAITHRINKAEASFPKLQEERAALQEQRGNLQNQLDELETSRANHEQHSNSVLARKRQLESSRGGGPYAPYGNNVANFVQEIGRRRWQGQTPIGPLGVGVKLKDMRYQEIVHSNLGSILSSFAVTKASDANMLRQMFREFGQRHHV